MSGLPDELKVSVTACQQVPWWQLWNASTTYTHFTHCHKYITKSANLESN